MTAQTDANWYSPEAATFGDRLSGAREEAGLTQEQLARNIGVKLKTLRAWEEDLSEPRANKLSMMAGLLNVSLLWLMTGEGDGPAGPHAADMAPDVTELLSEVRDLHTVIAASADRLARLERQLRGNLQVEAAE